MHFPWYVTLIFAIFTGLISAIITVWESRRKNKKQKIHYSVSHNTVFHPSKIYSNRKISLLIERKGEQKFDLSFSNLYSTNLTIKNTSNKDFDNFALGLKFTHEFSIISYSHTSKGHLHKIEAEPIVLTENSKHSDINLTLSPFNRLEEYTIILYSTNELHKELDLAEEHVGIDSAMPVELIPSDDSISSLKSINLDLIIKTIISTIVLIFLFIVLLIIL